MFQPGQMMDRPLLISGIIEHAAAQFGNVEVVSRETHGPLFRYTWADCAVRSRKLANALKALGLGPGSAVGSIAWNNHRHLEAYFAVSGSGMVMHTCNPRLQAQQLVYIINHAEDEVVLFDTTFAPLVKGIAAHCPKVKAWVCLSDGDNTVAVDGVANVLCYEDLIAPHDDRFDWPDFDERTGAALCYTSGTTGNPKGVLYSHRAILLNALTGCLPGVISLSPKDTVLPVVPMFHINAWCIPYGAPMAGARLVLPGPRLDGASLYELMEAERVTVSAGVPIIWLGLLQHLQQHGLKFSTMRRTAVGGSAMPAALIARFVEDYGVEVRHGWGMTETTAASTFGSLMPEDEQRPLAEQHALVAKQGKSLFGVEIKVVDDTGATLPRDGTSQGELMVRGQWIVSGYYKGESSPLVDGWFPTGDIATIEPGGIMQIRDRTKDVIKSGGEWISSIDLENVLMAHPAVHEAAAIACFHPKWDERPLMVVVKKPGVEVSVDELIAFYDGKIPKWQTPDDVVFVDEIPHTATGKISKLQLRERFKDHKLPTA